MQTFTWGAQFATGLDTVDEQHHTLVDLINALGDSLLNGPLSAHDAGGIIARLRQYTVRHFRDEEAMMRERGLHPPALQVHRLAHQSFADEVTRFECDLATMTEAETHQLHDYLVHWLGYHILGMDLDMARQLRRIAQGETPRAAYEAEQARDQGPLQPLLDAIVGLLRIVESKNQALRAANASLESQVEARTRELRELSEAMRELAMHDQLTGLPNRRRATDFLESRLGAGATLSCLMIDVDNFKLVNDSRGHEAGDEVLRHVAWEIKGAFRTDDVVCRIGGDEFLVLCPDTLEQEAVALAESIRGSVQSLRIPAGDRHITLSIGVADSSAFRPSPSLPTPTELLRAADEALYAAKRGGRNAVASAARCAGQPPVGAGG
jgi:hemerythrin